MNDLRTAAQQALEAVEDLRGYRADIDEAIHALNAALAQQAEPDWQDLYLKEKQRADMWRDKYESVAGAEQRIYLQAEPVEPVAWMHNILEDNIIRHRPADLKRSPQNWTPLCNCAPPRHPDTDCHTQGICQRSGYGIGQQAEPVEPVGAVLVNRESREGVMFYSADMIPDSETLKDRFELVKVYTAPPRQTDPQIEDRLARHGIPKP